MENLFLQTTTSCCLQLQDVDNGRKIAMFTTDNSHNIVIPDPKMINPRAIVVIRHGKIVGVVSAEWNFANLPQRYHQIVANMLGTIVVYDSIPESNLTKRAAYEKPTGASLLQKLLAVFRR